MLLDQFRSLSASAQLAWVLAEGTPVGLRWTLQGNRRLYHLPTGGCGFFVEVGLNDTCTGFAVLRSFRSSEPLQDYTVQLTDLY